MGHRCDLECRCSRSTLTVSIVVSWQTGAMPHWFPSSAPYRRAAAGDDGLTPPVMVRRSAMKLIRRRDESLRSTDRHESDASHAVVHPASLHRSRQINSRRLLKDRSFWRAHAGPHLLVRRTFGGRNHRQQGCGPFEFLPRFDSSRSCRVSLGRQLPAASGRGASSRNAGSELREPHDQCGANLMGLLGFATGHRFFFGARSARNSATRSMPSARR